MADETPARQLSLRAKILWIAFLINALCTAFLTWNSYRDLRGTFLAGMDQKLRAAVLALPSILPAGYHDRITGPGSISPEEFGQVTAAIERYADETGLDYLYSYVYEGGRFFETASNPGAGDTIQTPFYYEVRQPPEGMLQALQAGQIVFREYADEWGRFRGAFMGMTTPSGRRYLVGADESVEFVHQELRAFLLRSLGLGVLIFVVVWVGSHLVLARVLSPVGRLVAYTEGLARTDFLLPEAPRKELQEITRRHNDEAGRLAGQFVEMSDKLGKYLEDLRRTTAEKERLESELQIARDIQMSFLKTQFPPFPERRDFDLFALVEPAREVGGDLYDFALLDGERLLFYVGDVSDKGVPASLFMAVTMTLMKRVYSHGGDDPAEVLREVNESLVRQNQNLQFVTVVCGILNTRTGELRYSNAGHNPPVIVRAGGSAEWLPLPVGMVLGVMPEAVYTTRTAQLGKGDLLVLYTDGVTEAMDPARHLYSEQRLEELAGSLVREDADGAARRIMASVRSFAAGATQSDDITLLTLKVGTRGGLASAAPPSSTAEATSGTAAS